MWLSIDNMAVPEQLHELVAYVSSGLKNGDPTVIGVLVSLAVVFLTIGLSFSFTLLVRIK